MAFTVESGKGGTLQIDAASYRKYFEEIVYMKKDLNSWDDYTALNSLYEKGFYFTIIAHLLSKVTNNYHIMFTVFAIVFAFFSIKSLQFLIEEKKYDNSISAFLLTIMFILSNSIFNINGVRFWTAAWIGVYCIFQIFRNNNLKYLFLLCTTPIIHTSFYIFIFIILLTLSTKKFERIWITLFLISIVFSFIATEFGIWTVGLLPNFLADEAKMYLYRERIAVIDGTMDIILETAQTIMHIYVNITAILFILNKKILEKNRLKVIGLYSFLLVLLTFVNFTMTIPSVGVRFFALTLPIVAYIWLVTFKDIKYKKFHYSYFIIYLFPILKIFYLCHLVTEPFFYISNPFLIIYKYLFI
jgi:hypothetical protein